MEGIKVTIVILITMVAVYYNVRYPFKTKSIALTIVLAAIISYLFTCDFDFIK